MCAPVCLTAERKEKMTEVLEGILWALRFLTGACIFSFLNVVVYRLPRGRSVVYGRSFCPGCGKTLTSKELIPCVSYLIQKGKCRACGMKIKKRYVLMEFAGGFAFVFCGIFFGCGKFGLLSLQGSIAFAYLCILVMVALIDWDTRIIYDRFHIAVFLLGIVSCLLFPANRITDCLIGSVIVSLPMFLLAVLIEGAFGGGDIKLMAASGFLLGWRAVLVAMFLGLIFGGIYCAVMLARGRLSRKDPFAFGPFLATGLAAAFFWGNEIADAYASFL